MGCEDITSIKLPNSLKKIYGGAFARCSNLTSVNIPLHVERIGKGAFRECEGIKEIMANMTNIPSVDPHYKQRRAITKKALKRIVFSYCSGANPQVKTSYDEGAIIPEYLPIWSLFKRVDFDFYSFMMNEDYNQIEDDIERDEILIYCFSFLYLPIARFMPDVANGYLEIRDIASTFFCSNEHDIWRLIAEKEIMDVSSLYTWYKGQNLEPILEKVTGIPCQNEKDDDKAEEFLIFLLDEKTNATDKVRMNAIALRQLSTQFIAND